MTFNLIDRFWSKVNKTSTCWNWTASTTSSGYGQIWVGSKVVRAHTVSYNLTYGKLPKDKDVIHKCNNPKCVRPDHLYAINYRDRAPKGSKNGTSILKEKEVLAIRNLYENEGISMTQLGKTFAVSKQTIHSIIRRQSWKHI